MTTHTIPLGMLTEAVAVMNAEIAQHKQTLTHMAGHVADLSAMVDGQSAEIAELREALGAALMPLELCHAYGWPDRKGVIYQIRAVLATPLEAQS